MHGLLLRLSAIDAEAEAAVRVIASFDQLVARRADVSGLLRSAAGLAECRVGISDSSRGIAICVGPDGRALEGDGAEPSELAVHAALDDGSGGDVWLDRPCGPGPLDEIIAERLAVASVVVLERMFTSSLFMADPAAVELLLSENAPEVDRARSARLLGFGASSPVRVIAVAEDEQAAAAATTRAVEGVVAQLRASGEICHVVRIGETFAIVTTSSVTLDGVPEGIRLGVGPAGNAIDASSSWVGARAALRFTLRVPGLKRPALATADDLGSQLTFAQLPADQLRSLPDVVALDRLSQNGRSEYIETLDALCRTGSLRRAAEEIYLHHTSVAARMTHISDALGYSVGTAEGMFRARLTLTFWQLSHSSV